MEQSHTRTTKILLGILVASILFGIFYIPTVNSTIKQVYQAEVKERDQLYRDLLKLSDVDFTVGATNPKVHIITYNDTDCEYCHKMEPRFERLLREYPYEVAITYRSHDLPTYPHSTYEMLALECVGIYAGAQAYREFQNNFLYPNQFTEPGDYTEQVTLFANSFLLGNYAEEVSACIKDPATKERIDRKRATGSTLGARLTPTMVYVDREGNYKLQSGSLPYEQLLPALNAFLGPGNELGK